MLRLYVLTLTIFFTTIPALSAAQNICGIEPAYPCLPGGPSAALYAGYGTNGNETDIKLTAQDEGIGGSGERRYDYGNLSAFVAGGQVPIQLASCAMLHLSSSITFPIVSDLRADDYDTDDELLGGRTWKSDSLWGTAEGLFAYSVMGRAWIMAGFRWDYWQTSLTEPTNASSVFRAHSDTDTAGFTFNGYLPVIGVVGSGCGFSLGAVGFPGYYGDFEYTESRNGADEIRLDKSSGSMNGGFMVEAFAEYTHPPIRLGEHVQGCFSIFGQFNTIRAEASSPINRTGDFVEADMFDFTLQRNFYVVGGKININFTVPLNCL